MVCESHEHGHTYGLVLAVGDERARRSVSPGHATSITEGGMRNELAVLQQARARLEEARIDSQVAHRRQDASGGLRARVGIEGLDCL